MRALHEFGLVFDEREHRRLKWRDARAEFEQHALFRLPLVVGHFVLLVRGGHHSQERAVHAERRFYDVRQVFFLARLVEVFEVFAGGVLVLGEVEIPAHGDSLQFLQAVREMESDVRTRLCVVRELFLRVDVLGELVGGDSDGYEPLFAGVDPVAVHRLPIVVGRNEVFDFHLFELAAAEYEIARRDFIAERLADLRDAEGDFDAARVADIFEVGEYSLRGLGAQVGDGCFVAQRADVCLEHQVEIARGG